MKCFWKRLLFVVMVCFVLLMVSCKSEKEQDIFDTVIETVNKQNEKLDAPTNIPKQYYYLPHEQAVFQNEDFELLTETDQKSTVSRQEIQQELEWLLRLLRTYYGGYGKFGGDAAFENAVDNLLNETGEKERIDYMEYCELLEKHFSFVTDNHFILGGKTNTSNKGHLYGNENEKFYQHESCFYDDASFKNPIISINGEKPEKFLKLAIDEEGKLSYLPYLSVTEDGVNTSLTVKYENQKERNISLSMTDYVSSRDYDDSPTNVYQEKKTDNGQEIVYNHFTEAGSDSAEKFIESAKSIGNYSYTVYDIALNSGGYAEVLEKWFQTCTGEVLQPNQSQMIRKGFFDIQINEDIEGETKKLKNKMNELGAYEDDAYYTWIPQKQFIDTDNSSLLILKTSSATGSCGEFMTDACRNIKNTIIIGGNTSGSLSGDMSAKYFTLPYSGVPFNFGPTVFEWNEEYFQENVGLEPDIYLTGSDCETRFEKFLDTYVR